MESAWVDKWFDEWFLVAVGLTAVGVWVGKKMGEGDDWDGDMGGKRM